MSSKEELLQKLHDTVVAFDEEGTKQAAEEIVSGGHDPLEAVMKGLAYGMETVGRLFKEQEYFVPEVLLCADALNAGMAVLKPHIPSSGEDNTLGRVVIGTIQGDVHDIGKNLVKLMLEVGGFTVHDLGNNVPYESFIEEQERTGAEIIGISAMLTTTMMGMKKVIEMAKKKNPRIAVMIGGAPVTPNVVKLFKADGYAQSASTVVAEAKRLMEAFCPAQ
ncbi:MAG: corrinoid protein [Syntrophobacteraceae bacterium]|nr:corrinoid protein [Desulfobacteraceae bacterium]